MAHKQQTKEVRLRAVPEETVRQLKSQAALSGQSMEDFLTDLITKALKEKK